MKYKEYLIKKDKVDLLSSLKAINKKIIVEKLKKFELKNIDELKEYIIKEFEMFLDSYKDDPHTQMYFIRLLDYEDSKWMSAYEQDIESLFVFVYENGKNYSYYIPIEIKIIIKNMLKEMACEENINLQNAANIPIVKDLKCLLNSLFVKDLKHIGELFLINRLSNKPKKELINIVYKTLTDEEKISEVIERFNDKEFELLKKLMVNKGTVQNDKINMEEYHFLYMLGLVFLFKQNNQFYVSMTDDIYNTIKKLNISKFEKIIDENTKVYNLVKAMIELYGVVSYEELSYYYSLYYGNGEDFDIPNNVLFYIDRYDNIVSIHTEHSLYFINKILDNDKLENIIDDIIDKQTKIKKKPIKIKELLKYLDNNYYEDNDSKREFKKYLKAENVPNKITEEIVKNISRMYRLGNTFIGATIGMLEEYGIQVTEKNMRTIINYLISIYNNTRVWTNNGWTPVEMRSDYN